MSRINNICKLVDVMDTLLLAFKITNWCNLTCNNCRGRSSVSCTPQLMDINLIAKYISEFKKLPYNVIESVTLRGGEATAPYSLGDYEYIPNCLDVIRGNDMIPVLQTNGMWGRNNILRKRILGDLYNVWEKYKSKAPVLEISLSGFYDNISSVAKILTEFGYNQKYSYSIETWITGNEISEKSLDAQRELLVRMCRYGLRFKACDNGVYLISNELNNIIIFNYDFSPLVPIEPKAVPVEVGCPWVHKDYLEIDNVGNATLNGEYRTQIQNRPLATVVAELMARTK